MWIPTNFQMLGFSKLASIQLLRKQPSPRSQGAASNSITPVHFGVKGEVSQLSGTWDFTGDFRGVAQLLVKTPGPFLMDFLQQGEKGKPPPQKF